MSTEAGTRDRRLIEDWLPVNELSVEAIREGGALAGHPPVNQLHVWWARRPLVVSRAAIAASVLKASSDHKSFVSAIGSSPSVVAERRRMDEVKARGEWSNVTFSNKRAFTHNLTSHEATWLHDSLATPDPLVVDITAGGGSIPFEAGRLGLRSHANELNPVAGLILRATCKWPQHYGSKVLDHYGREVGIGKFNGIAGRYLKRVRELLEGVYPEEEQPAWMAQWNERFASEIENEEIVRAKRYVWSYLFARTVSCPSCGNEIPLSPNWRLNSSGKGLRLLPNEQTGVCDFEIVETAAAQSAGTVKSAIATCPYPDCGATTPKGYIAQEAQAGRLGHRPYAVIMRDQWHEFTKAGLPKKRLTTKRHFRAATHEDNNLPDIQRQLSELRHKWGRRRYSAQRSRSFWK